MVVDGKLFTKGSSTLGKAVTNDQILKISNDENLPKPIEIAIKPQLKNNKPSIIQNNQQEDNNLKNNKDRSISQEKELVAISKNKDRDSMTKGKKKNGRKNIAFAITVTSDGKVLDGACVLAYSIVKSYRDLYHDVTLVAFIHPNVSEARKPLQRLGYQ
jgi:hypothetical protein